MLFRCDVVLGVAAIGNCVPLQYHPAIQVYLAISADGDDPFVAINIPLLTRDRACANLVSKSQGGSLSASILLAILHAKLPAFRRVDAVKSNPLSMDFDRIAVDY